MATCRASARTCAISLPLIAMTPFPKVDPAQVTPEHLQLLSDARLRALADDASGRPTEASETGWQRLARYELKRRSAAVRTRALVAA